MTDSDGPGEFSCRRSADGGITKRAKKAKKDESAPQVEAHQDAIIGDELSPLVVGGEKFWSKRFKERTGPCVYLSPGPGAETADNCSPGSTN